MSKERNSFRGKVVDTADKREKARSNFSYLNLPKGLKTFSIKEGTRKVLMDIIPYVVTDPKHPDNIINKEVAKVGDLWYKRPIKIHRNVGADNETVICPKSIGEQCPICDFQKKRYTEGADKEETKELYARPRNLYAIIPLDSDDFDDDVCIWDMSQILFEDILIDEIKEDQEQYEIFPSLEEGLSLEVTFKWETIGKNSYPKARKIRFVKREAYDEDVLTEVPDIDSLLKVLSYKDIEAKFFEIDPDDDDGGNLQDVDKPEVKETTPRKRRKSVEKKEEEPKTETENKEEVPDAPVRRRKSNSIEKKETPEKSKDDEKCPHKHTFGEDNDKFDECYECTLFDDCYDENRAMKK